MPTLESIFGDATPIVILGSLIGIVNGIYTLAIKLLPKAKVSVHVGDRIGLVRESLGLRRKLHIGCTFTNEGSRTGVIHRLELEVRGPEPEMRYVWALFYGYKNSGQILEKISDVHALTVRPGDSIHHFIEFQERTEEPLGWNAGEYEIAIKGWVNNKSANEKPNISKTFRIEVTPDDSYFMGKIDANVESRDHRSVSVIGWDV